MQVNDLIPLLKRFTTAVEILQAIAVVATTAGSLALLAYFAITRGLLVRDYAAIFGPLLAICVITMLAGWAYVRNRWEPSPYDILDARCELVIEAVGDHHRYTYTKHQTVRARREIRLIEFRAHWTGHGSVDTFRINALHDHVLLDGGQPEEDLRIYRWVYPKYPVPRGQIVSVGIRQVHEDDLVRQEPYYRDGGGRYRIAHLVVVARFPLNERPRRVEGRVWNSNRPTGRARLLGTVPTTLNVDENARTIDYVVEVKRPRRHHSYGLRWTWPR